jgi:hypothetical protein
MIRLLLGLLLATGTLRAADEPVPTQRIGQPLVIADTYIPGGEVKAKPRRDRKPPLVVRILEIRPAKDGSRYNFEVQGLDPGRYNLAEFLEVPEGTAIQEIPLEITAELAPGLVKPHATENGELPKLGGYRTTMIVLVSIWAAGFAGILLWRKKRTGAAEGSLASGPTLAERLRPLVGAASKGELSTEERAKLERLVIGHWREKRGDIAALPPAEAMVKLRNDPDASPLVLALERWLHAPSSNTTTSEIEALLSPYGGGAGFKGAGLSS